ncbi:MAG: hypothetical protein R2753_10640 [Chitinophagales bacterium]
MVAKKLLIDFNSYFSIYRDFMVEQTVAVKTGVTVAGVYYQGVDNVFAGDFGPSGTATSAALFRPTLNAPGKIKSFGGGLGLAYKLPKGFRITASYNYDDFTYNKAEFSEDFSPQFNLGKHKWQASLSNQDIVKGFGFDLSYRWTSDTYYESSFAVATIPHYGVLNGQISYKIPRIKTIMKVGGQNLLRKEYQTNPGGPTIGWQYYVGFTFDQLFDK